MNVKLTDKAKLINATLASNLIGRTSPAACEAVGYVLAYDATLPSSELRHGLSTSDQLTDVIYIASYLGENTMHCPRDIMQHAYRFYEVRHAAAFNGTLFASAILKGLSFQNKETTHLIRTLLEAFTETGNSTTTSSVAACNG